VAVVCNANDKVYPAKTQDGPITGDGPLNEMVQCPAPYYCTPNVPFITYYRDPQCRGDAAASYELYGNAHLGKCYLDQRQGLNVKMTCERNVLTVRAFASGCSNPEYARTQLSSSECFFDQSGQGYKYFCGSTSFTKDHYNATENTDFLPNNHFDLVDAAHKYLRP
jgi:hypothetical protein